LGNHRSRHKQRTPSAPFVVQGTLCRRLNGDKRRCRRRARVWPPRCWGVLSSCRS